MFVISKICIDKSRSWKKAAIVNFKGRDELGKHTLSLGGELVPNKRFSNFGSDIVTLGWLRELFLKEQAELGCR